MNENQFEERLRRQPPREVPAGWRNEILSTVSAAGSRPSVPDPRPSLLSTLTHQLSTLFWPHPKAWAGLATVWVAIMALNFSARDNSSMVAARQVVPPSPEAIAAWRQQRRELASLTEPNQSQEVEVPKPQLPQPRSGRRDEIFAA